ncbi:MAG TPA: hemin uptake protein HemP [Burkholderiaceae bacterium]
MSSSHGPHPNPLPQAGEGAALLPLPLAGEGRGEGARSTQRISSQQLFRGALEVHIDHFGAIYRLKQTALGKLILTK